MRDSIFQTFLGEHVPQPPSWPHTSGVRVFSPKKIEPWLHHCYQRTNGSKRALLNDKVYKLSVKRGAIESIEKIKSELSISKDELEECKKKCNDLEEECKKHVEEMMKEKIKWNRKWLISSWLTRSW